MKATKLAPVFLAVFLSVANVCHGQQGTSPLQNNDVIQMIGAGLGDDAVIDLIQSSSTQFDLSPNGLAAIKKARVDARVIAAMRAAEAAKHTAARTAGGGGGAASGPTQMVPTSPPPCQPAPSQSTNAPAAPAPTPSASPSVAIVANGNGLALQSSMAQVAQTNSAIAGPLGNGLNLQSLEKLASSNLNFATLSSKALMFMPQVAVATKLMGAFHHTTKPATSTIVLGLPGLHATVTAPGAPFVLDVQYGNVNGLDPDAYEPALVQLTPSGNFRLIGARQMVQQANGVPQPGAITEKRVEVKVTRVDRGHVTLEPSTPLPAGEYGVVLRFVGSQSSPATSMPGATQASQLEYMAWDFSVPQAGTTQQ